MIDTNSIFPHGALVIALPAGSDVRAAACAEYAKHDIHLSNRKLKLLEEHHWLKPGRLIVPWGFFSVPLWRSRLLYEDDFLIAVDKPPFISVLTSPAHPSLYNLWKNKYHTLSAVHRLDFETSGAMLFAKTKQSYKALVGLFRRQAICKTYYAWVHGVPDQNTWQVRAALHATTHGMVVHPQGELSAKTTFRCLASVRGAHDRAYSLIEARPHTGRKHQIRCHLYASHTPVVGETIYGGISPERLRGVRLQLHSAALSFELSGRPYDIQCEAPADFLSPKYTEVGEPEHGMRYKK